MKIPDEEKVRGKDLHVQLGFYMGIKSRYRDDPKTVREANRRIEAIRKRLNRQLRKKGGASYGKI